MFLILKYFMLACFAYVIIRIVVPYLVLFIRFMFNEPFKWDKFVEKPRLVFYAIGLLNMQLGFNAILEHPGQFATFYLIVGCFLFLGGIFMTQVTWTKRFKKVFIPKIKEKLKTPRNFNISISESQLGKLYDNMVRYDMVIIDETSKDDFIQCFLKNWDEHDAKIHLKLKNPSCKEFYELFKLTFPKNDLQLIDFIKNSDLLRREDGQPYNYDTVRNALTRNRFSKRSEELEAVFAPFS
ncbi:hypothetical protein ACOKFD_01645 [Flagellimonas sp. S174]|uniref:hypothetical protein n=1 Tax=Flagellimonas sp. S174 TaxID=3410790 RepID=UPI003BF4D76C